jgi:hypothetical protein
MAEACRTLNISHWHTWSKRANLRQTIEDNLHSKLRLLLVIPAVEQGNDLKPPYGGRNQFTP